MHSVLPSIHQGMVCDLGVLLWGFFDRFGNRFDYDRQAVSVRQGGITTKLKVGGVCVQGLGFSKCYMSQYIPWTVI